MVKKIIQTVLFYFCLIALVYANNNVLNIYTWAGYINPKIVSLFEKETGIKIHYGTFTTNQALYTKLKADPYADFDIIMPSTYLVDRMYHENLLLLLDKSKIPNFKYLDPALLNKQYDPHNQYSIPFLWGTTGIVINTKVYSHHQVTSWADLWNPKYKNKVVVLDDMRDTFSMAFRVLGYSINDQNPKHIEAAYLKLKALYPNIRSFEENGSLMIYGEEEADIGMMASGDAYILMQSMPNYIYIYPKEGPNVWMDSMVIPLHAKHVENAYRFINFMLRPGVAAMVSESVGYATPNLAAIKLLPKEMRNNIVFNPPKSALISIETKKDLAKETLQLYLHYWELLKNM